MNKRKIFSRAWARSMKLFSGAGSTWLGSGGWGLSQGPLHKGVALRKRGDLFLRRFQRALSPAESRPLPGSAYLLVLVRRTFQIRQLILPGQQAGTFLSSTSKRRNRRSGFSSSANERCKMPRLRCSQRPERCLCLATCWMRVWFCCKSRAVDRLSASPACGLPGKRATLQDRRGGSCRQIGRPASATNSFPAARPRACSGTASPEHKRP